MEAINEEPSDAIPLDIPTGDRTVVVQLDAERQVDQDLDMTPNEREFLRVIEVTYTDFRKNQRVWGHAHLMIERGKLQGLLIGLEVVATTINAQIQASLWADKLSRIR